MTQSKGGGSLIGKIGSYLQIVTKDPHSTAFVPLAEAYRQIGLLDDALEAARLCTQMLPHFSPGFATMGRILGQMGRIDEAISVYAKALSMDQESQAALVGVARLHLIRGERDQARKILHQAAEYHPEDDSIRNMLTALDLPRPWAEIKQSTEAQEPKTAEIVEPATAEETDAPIPTATLAEIYVKQGLVDKAIKVYETLLVQNPENEKVRNRLTHLIAESSGQVVMGAVPPVFATETVDEIESQPSKEEQVDAVVQPEAIVPPAKKTPLAILESWLIAIKEGKVHV